MAKRRGSRRTGICRTYLAAVVIVAAAGLSIEGGAHPASAQEEVERRELETLTPEPPEDAVPADEEPPAEEEGQALEDAAAPATGSEAAGAGSAVPQIWRIDPDAARPDLGGRDPIRIFVGDDYPPFNYMGGQGEVTGLNVELAQALCTTLRVRCEITALGWEELVPGLLAGYGDAIIASMRITADALESVEFTKPYLRTPARFAVRAPSDLDVADPGTLAGHRVGVVRGTAHEAYLTAFFPTAIIRLYDSDEEAREALRNEAVDALFGDGAALIFWVLAEASEGCCELAPGAYTEPYFFGDGVGIAVRRGDKPLKDAFEFALDQVKLTGVYDRLLRKYLPLALF